MIRTLRAAWRASFLVALVPAAVAGLACAPGSARAAESPAEPSQQVTTKQASSFEIYAGDRRLGTEKFRVYAIADTIVMTSEVVLDGASPTSGLPLSKSAAFRQRAFDSYPVAFVAEEHPRGDTTRVNRVLCAFRDTVAMITLDLADRGRVEAVGLPPGRLYILEPGIYLQMQVLFADFLARAQDERKQSVLIPSLARVLDVQLKRGPEADISLGRRHVKTTRVDMTDELTTFHAWLDADGRMWKLVADGQSLHVERSPDDAAPKAKGAPTRRAPAKRTTRKTG